LAGKCLYDFVPKFVNAVPVRWRKQQTMASALAGMTWTADITGALSVQVLVQLANLYQQIQQVQLVPSTVEHLEWRWVANGSYSSCSAYAALVLGQTTVLGA
jgi:hypothetical protein